MQPDKPDKPQAICGAKCRDGHPCQSPPMRGATRCRMHGAANQRTRQAAKRRLAEAEAAHQVEAWGGRLDINPLQALLDLVAEKAAEVAYWQGRVAALDERRRAAAGGDRPGPHVHLRLLHATQDQLASYAAAALKAGADRVVVEAVQLQAAQLVAVVERALAHAGVPAEDAALHVAAALEIEGGAA